MADHYFATNELKDAVFSLKIVNEMLTKVREDSLYWKWVFIALHNSLQGFMVTCLCPFNDFAVMQPAPKPPKCSVTGGCCVKQERPWGSREEWEAFCRGESEIQPKLPRMLGFMDLYNRITDRDHMEQFSCCYQAFEPAGTQTDSVKRLNKELRNPLVHFRPKMMCRPVEKFPRITRDIIKIIDFMAFESDAISWSTSSAEQLCSETKGLIKDILGRLDELEEHHKTAPKKDQAANPE